MRCRLEFCNTIAYLVSILACDFVRYATELYFTGMDESICPFNQKVNLSVFIAPSTALSGYAINTQRFLNRIHMCQANGLKSQALPGVQFWLADEVGPESFVFRLVILDKPQIKHGEMVG